MTTFLRSPEYRKQLRNFFLTNKAQVRKTLTGVSALAGVHEPALQIISPTVSTVILPGVAAVGAVTTTNTIISAGGTLAVFEEDFSTYADTNAWQANTHGWYSAGPTTTLQFIDTAITDPEVTTSSQSLRVQYPTGATCGAATVGFSILKWQDNRIIADISPDLTEVWIEMRVRFDSAWNTNDTDSCPEPENHQLLRAHVGDQGQTPYFQLNDGSGIGSFWNIGAPPDDLGQSQGDDSDGSLINSDNTWNLIRCNFKLSEVTKTIPDGRAFFELNSKRLIGRNSGFSGEDLITAAIDPLGTGETYNNFTKIQFLGELKPRKTTPVQKLWISRIKVFDQDPGWPVSFQNEPANYTVISERTFDAFKEDGWDNVGEGGNYQVPIVDAAALISPNNVGQARYPLGFTGGVATHNAFLSLTATNSLYIAFAIKYSSNWQGHNSGVNKIFFVTAPDYGGAGDPVYFSAQGADSNALNFQVRLQGPGDESSASAGSNLGSNLASATLTRDVWYKVEVLLTANTDTSFNGELAVWIDGVKTHEYTDIKYYDDAADPSAHKWNGVKWNPTWGGTGDTVIATMHHWIDHIRVSGP